MEGHIHRRQKQHQNTPQQATKTQTKQKKTSIVNKKQQNNKDTNVPFGGAKQSGIGTELGQEGLLEFTQLKVISQPAAG